MPRLTFPTASDLLAQPAPDGRPDPFSTYQRADGILSVSVADAGDLVHLTRSANGALWLVERLAGVAGPALTEPMVQRLNRLLSSETDGGAYPAPDLTKDWRNGVHALRSRPRHTLPLTPGTSAVLRLGPSGWDVAVADQQDRLDVVSTAPAPAPVRAVAVAPAPTPPAPSAPVAPVMPSPAAPVAPVAADPGGAMIVLRQPLVPTSRSKAYEKRAIVPPHVGQRWALARASHEAGYPSPVMFVGPSGAAKGHVVMDLADDAGCDLIKFSMSSMKEPSEFFGNVDAVNGTVRFTPSTALLALTEPLTAPERGRILLLDEATRASGVAMNALLEIMDGSGFLTVPQLGKQMVLNPAVQVVMTANIGADHLYTEPLDNAVWTRVASWIRLDYLNEADETAMLQDRVPGLTAWHAAAIAKAAAGIRESAKTGLHPSLSHRQTLAVAVQIAHGPKGPGMARQAAESVLLDAFNPEGEGNSEQAKVRTHIAGVTWDEPTDLAQAIADATV